MRLGLHADLHIPHSIMIMASDKERYAKKLHDCRVLLETGTYPEGLNNNEKRMLRRMKYKFMLDSNGKLVTVDGREVVPDEKEQEKIVRKVHEGEGGAHLGKDKTVQELTAQFYWKYIGNDVAHCIDKCKICQGTNNKFEHLEPRAKSPVVEKVDQAEMPAAAVHSIPVSRTWEIVGIDIVGPFPTTERGNKYLITLCDLFSRWPEAAAVPDKSADSVAKFLMEVMMRMGFVKVISNQNEEFVSMINAKLSAKCGVQLSLVRECHYQANRMVKRFSNTLETALTKVVNQDRNDWDDHVESILFAYRTSVHATTQLSPFLVMFGREAVLPIDLMYSSPEPSAPPSEPESYEEFVETMKKERKRIHEQLTENVERAQNRRPKRKGNHSD